MPAKPNQTSLFIVNFLTGISDGLLLPFAGCIIAYPYFGNDPMKLACTGLIIAFIGGLVYGLARFLGESEEIRHNHPQLALDEAEKEAALMKAIGIDAELTSDMQAQMSEDRNLWLREVEENCMGWKEYNKGRALKSGMQTAFGFFTGGLLVCLPFFFVYKDIRYLVFPCFFYLVWLSLFGWVKGEILAVKSMRPTLHLVSRGLVLMVLAFAVVTFIRVKKDKMDFTAIELPPTDRTP